MIFQFDASNYEVFRTFLLVKGKLFSEEKFEMIFIHDLKDSGSLL